ncbi:p38 MAP kinase [Penicillium chrysogenum]|uniref:P38 MAP kinase n=1 Tax=Penicillium chrysogenum TaxID=5076 RepID=A0ABQ8WWQ4_PENCH|nr:p38 MAP kinase [Penicillium chrysogenum]
MGRFVRSTVLGGTFETTVSSARDQIGQQPVAVKKLSEPLKTAGNAQHIFKEIQLLKHLKHENIINLVDPFISPSEDIYLVTDLMQTDLQTLLKTKPIEGEFVQFFVYQIMARLLVTVRGAGVVHRDLNPGNILVNENCDLKICDFGLARVQEHQMMGYVSTRYYRAPETMLTWQRYDEHVDIWSTGCIFAEMLQGKPLFPGRDHIDQFRVTTEVLGTPPENVIAKITAQNTLRYIGSLPKREGKPLSDIFRNADPKAINLERHWFLIRRGVFPLPKLLLLHILRLTMTPRMNRQLKKYSIGIVTDLTAQMTCGNRSFTPKF